MHNLSFTSTSTLSYIHCAHNHLRVHPPLDVKKCEGRQETGKISDFFFLKVMQQVDPTLTPWCHQWFLHWHKCTNRSWRSGEKWWFKKLKQGFGLLLLISAEAGREMVRAPAIGWESGWMCGQQGSQTALGLRRIFLSHWLDFISFLSYSTQSPGPAAVCSSLKGKKQRCAHLEQDHSYGSDRSCQDRGVWHCETKEIKQLEEKWCTQIFLEKLI